MNLSKRKFLRGALVAPIAATVLSRFTPSIFADTKDDPHAPHESSNVAAQGSIGIAPFLLPPLTYSFSALEPHIDAQTMQLHHDKHHQTYITRLNEAVANYPRLRRMPPEDLIANLRAVPADIREAVKNNGGGHANHTMFWRLMSPQGGGEPTGEIARVIRRNFSSFDNFKQEFNTAGERRFGSGWVWLVRSGRGRFQIKSTANQDSPLMDGEFPVMGNDVWEHAYYLKYNNRRADYLKAWWNVVNWEEVNRRLDKS